MSLTSILRVRTLFNATARKEKQRQGYILLGVPPAEKLDFLAELGDVLGKRLNRSHFEGLGVLGSREGPFGELESVGDDGVGSGGARTGHLFDLVVPAMGKQGSALRQFPLQLYSSFLRQAPGPTVRKSRTNCRYSTTRCREPFSILPMTRTCT